MVRISFKLFLCLIHSYQNIYLWKMKKFQFSLLCNLDSLQEVIRFSNKKSVTLLNFKLISIFNFSFKKWNFFSTILFKCLLHSFIASLFFFCNDLFSLLTGERGLGIKWASLWFVHSNWCHLFNSFNLQSRCHQFW